MKAKRLTGPRKKLNGRAKKMKSIIFDEIIIENIKEYNGNIVKMRKYRERKDDTRDYIYDDDENEFI